MQARAGFRACVPWLQCRAASLARRLPLPASIGWRVSLRRYQPFNYTAPDRYPWLFDFARGALPETARILSFGCSTGEEALSLHRYLPLARIKGIDIDPGNIAAARAKAVHLENVEFACAAAPPVEETSYYDAVFCLAVLCNGHLTATAAKRSDPYFRFEAFDDAVVDLVRCLVPGGLLFLLTTNFRFCDTRVAQEFDVVLTTEESRLAPDLIYDRDNRLMAGERYCDVGFRKRGS